jgi:hypothetical protein
MSREDISLLYDHDESLTEEQLRREIEHLNAELGKFKVREYRRSISLNHYLHRQIYNYPNAIHTNTTQTTI